MDRKNFHFVGIGGAGMSVLAKILIESGYTISGSDRADSSTLQMLKNLGAKVFVGHSAENISSDIDAIVCSSAIPADNPEVVRAAELNIPKLHRSDINAMLLNVKNGIAVAGAHGKTTTTSMIGFILYNAGIDPTIIIGGESVDLDTGAILGKGDYLVSEADESDGSFVTLKPSIAVVTNIEDDHLDHYGTVEKIREAFKTFLSNIKPNGTAVLCYDNEVVRGIGAELDKEVISYAIDYPAEFSATNIRADVNGVNFDVIRRINVGGEIGKKFLGKVQLAIHGRHNVLNALATIAVAMKIGVTFEKIVDGLRKFHGAKRRFETKARIKDIWIVDDYGHHPTEIAATLKAAHEAKPDRIICIFQPHRYTRTKLLLNEFGSAFVDADFLILTDIYSAGEKPIEGISGESIVNAVIEKTNQQVLYVPEREKISEYLIELVRPGDLIITMGAGDIYKTAEDMIVTLNRRFKSHIVVVMGGPSTEAEVSRRTGKAIADALKTKNYNVETMELNPKTFADDIQKKNCSIVFNAVHGLCGEDGMIQGTLDMLNIPYTGSNVLAAALTMDKVATKRVLISEGVTTPKFEVYEKHTLHASIFKLQEISAQIKKNFSLPVVIKAPSQGSSIGVYIVERAEDIPQAVENAFKFGNEILVEEFIDGRELTVSILQNGNEIQALPIIEITTVTGRYDYDTKYTKGASKHICPAELSEELTKKIQAVAVKAFKVCKCAGVGRVDVILSKDNVPYVIEINSVPGMTETSLVPDAARAAGIEFPDLCEKILLAAEF
ncbi:MAG: UDP-N-acetylmuramate--L-alanine ligase [Selenomonadaceae bacterium]|nr:UDP-N-acetylmuramate--L-alanine ligase [Selenomonadaceae bacterium]